MSRIAVGGTARNYPHDPKETPVPLVGVAAARQPRLPRLRGGGLPARVVARPRGPAGAEGDDRRPGAGDRRGRGAPPVARPGRADAPPLARARRGGVLRDLLLLLGHPLLSRQTSERPGRPHAEPAGARPLPLLARLGARARAAD